MQFKHLVVFKLFEARSRRLAQVASWKHARQKAQSAALRIVDQNVTKRERTGTTTAKMAIVKRFAVCLALRPSSNRR